MSELSKNKENYCILFVRRFSRIPILNPKKREISVSRIFSWYTADFGDKEGILLTLEKCLEVPQEMGSKQELLSDFRLRFHPYDWDMNLFS